MYTYSFVDTNLIEKSGETTENLIPMKNALTKEMTHLRGSLIPNLLSALEENRKNFSDMRLFECEKIFTRNSENAEENYELSLVVQSKSENAFYEMRNILDELCISL